MTSFAVPIASSGSVSTALGWRLVNPRMKAEWTVPLGRAAEDVAVSLGITREQMASRFKGITSKPLASLTHADLDARGPLSVAPWHRHINYCFPTDRRRMSETRDGKPLQRYQRTKSGKRRVYDVPAEMLKDACAKANVNDSRLPNGPPGRNARPR